MTAAMTTVLDPAYLLFDMDGTLLGEQFTAVAGSEGPLSGLSTLSEGMLLSFGHVFRYEAVAQRTTSFYAVPKLLHCHRNSYKVIC